MSDPAWIALAAVFLTGIGLTASTLGAGRSDKREDVRDQLRKDRAGRATVYAKLADTLVVMNDGPGSARDVRFSVNGESCPPNTDLFIGRAIGVLPAGASAEFPETGCLSSPTHRLLRIEWTDEHGNAGCWESDFSLR